MFYFFLYITGENVSYQRKITARLRINFKSFCCSMKYMSVCHPAIKHCSDQQHSAKNIIILLLSIYKQIQLLIYTFWAYRLPPIILYSHSVLNAKTLITSSFQKTISQSMEVTCIVSVEPYHSVMEVTLHFLLLIRVYVKNYYINYTSISEERN